MAWYLATWRRMKLWGALPDPGGLLDQEERLMRMLEIIDDEVRAYEEQKSRARSKAPRNAGFVIGWDRQRATVEEE